MSSKKLIAMAWNGGWLTLVAATGFIWLFPLPFEEVVILGLGVVNGVLLERRVIKRYLPA